MKKGIKIGIAVLLTGLLLSGCGTTTKKKVTIGVLQLVTHPALDAALTGMTDYLKAQGYDESQVTIVVKNAGGDGPTAALIAQQFVTDKVDLIYAIATPAAQAAYNAVQGTKIPVVFNAVTDAVTAGIVTSNEKPGGQVTGVSDAAPLNLQVKLIRDFLPTAKKIGMLYNVGEVNGKIQVDQVKALAPAQGFEVVAIGVSATTEISAAAQQLASQVDCIYNITDNMVVGATSVIVDKANAKKIPVFAAEDGGMSQGLLASDGLSYTKLGKQAGVIVVDVLFKGKKPADIPVQTATDTALSISAGVAKALNITIPEALKTRATMLD